MTILTTSYTGGLRSSQTTNLESLEAGRPELRRVSSCPDLAKSSVEQGTEIRSRSVHKTAADEKSSKNENENDYVDVSHRDCINASIELELSKAWKQLLHPDFSVDKLLEKNVSEHAQNIVNTYLEEGNNYAAASFFFRNEEPVVKNVISQLKTRGFEDEAVVLERIETTVWSMMRQINHFNKYLKPFELPGDDPRLTGLNEMTHQPCSKIPCGDNHIAKQFKRDFYRDIKFYIHNNEGLIAFYASCQDGNYQYVESGQPAMKEKAFHSESATGSKVGELLKNEEDLLAAKETLLRAVQERIISFTEGNNELTTVLSDLLSQTGSNSLCFALTPYCLEDQMIAPKDRQYETHIIPGSEGKIALEMSLIIPSHTRLINGTKFVFGQSITIQARVILDPDKLNDRKFDWLKFRFTPLEWVKSE